ncbi:unnamed protein product [Acanthoscelides obtectus]|uniref:Uncharacterized protein n=1 Tax=Acanthoscelides obtectus TaxID=200917 RepID=A0A9P0M7X6_ACAOB|nr:unnamed protein product [Acanthoscelides obtectus]CAK1673543.1 hypothetical protein AOBTE_LOCUS29376 [Acanthoscelides obtectus]
MIILKACWRNHEVADMQCTRITMNVQGSAPNFWKTSESIPINFLSTIACQLRHSMNYLELYILGHGKYLHSSTI